MLELKAGAFYEATTRIVGTASYIGGTSSLAGTPANGRSFHKEKALDEIDRRFVESRLKGLPEHLATLGAKMTSLAVEEARGKLSFPTATWGTAKECLEDVGTTLRRELSLMTLFVLGAKEQKYFSPEEALFGDEVKTKFGSIAFDLDEAAKCYALGRPTASVFHQMRIMEASVRAVARCLKIPDPTRPAERNWGFVLGEIRKGIEHRWPTAADRMGGDGQVLESLYAFLDAVKNPWRNDTMHPAAKYTDDEAEHIFVAVCGFMKKLASRMDENGDPKV